ncbi:MULTISPECIES: helix-turn-helix transcriptional regulator [Prauserella salsuginis group]|uniref:LuxR C-terminal-related transcriptional regulator n=1 Tax=Prauserella salsuginis TaxID=387889 RepID=A0ABW6FXU4_9PSEU|nr:MULTISPECIES: LuxR C-terminal-related transcriptional regulator [Prauserella salsuginis group]MCR3720878.1 AAA ATPase domain-containing protein [Prauserella flava]MCR3735041.1 AAA ATPase domain-containing protein [Prauserella salsuginis]
MAAVIVGRDDVRARLAALHDDVGAGRGGALVLAGVRGMGRTTLVETVPTDGPVRTATVTGFAAESELPWAGLQRLCAAAGIAPGAVGDVAGHATTLYERLAAGGSVLCLVDDAHLLDVESLDVLAFMARRCARGPVAVVFTVPPEAPEADRLAGLDVERLPPLTDDEALRLVPGRIAAPVAAELVETAGGNPSDLLELAESLTAGQAAGRQPPPRELPAGGRGRDAVVRTFRGLSEAARALVLRAACAEPSEPFGATGMSSDGPVSADDPVLAEVQRCGLVRTTTDGVRAVSPAVGATVHAAVSDAERREAHAALAASLDPQRHRAAWEWHRACADGRTDVADRLAAAADDNPDTAALAWHRAARLTPPGAEKAERLRRAACRYWAEGRVGPARRLLWHAREHAPSGPLAGRILVAAGEIELRDGAPEVAAHQLMLAAQSLPVDEAADAFLLAAEARRTAADGCGYAETARRAAETETLVATHLAGIAAMFTRDHAAGAAALRRVLEEAGDDVRGALCAAEAAMTLGRPGLAHDRAAAAVARARGGDNPTLLPTALYQFSLTSALLDRPHAAVEASAEGVALAAASGQRNTAAEHEVLAGLAYVSLGDRDAALARVASAQARIDRVGLRRAAALADWVRGCADLLDDRPADAFRRLNTLFVPGTGRSTVQVAAIPQLVESAIRCGESDSARRALERYEAWAESTGTGVWLALAHRCRALLAADPATAEAQFRDAVELQRSGGMTLELARTELAYARALRRQRRNREARSVLRDAFRLADDAGADYWAAQIRDELRAAGDRAEEAAPSTGEDLTPQQERIVRLVADGRTNREIAERLAISRRTVEHHLRNIFVRLGVRSRVELVAAASGPSPRHE